MLKCVAVLGLVPVRVFPIFLLRADYFGTYLFELKASHIFFQRLAVGDKFLLSQFIRLFRDSAVKQQKVKAQKPWSMSPKVKLISLAIRLTFFHLLSRNVKGKSQKSLSEYLSER